MKIVEKNYIKGFKEYYYYKSDLEKFSTSELIDILRSLRCKESRYLEYQDENEWGDLEDNFTGDWLVFDWGEYHQSFAMIWMVKDVLSRRPHIPKSKAEKKAIRQMQAKYHIRIPKVK